MKKILDFGSFVVDLMARAPHLPKEAETVKGTVFKMGAGGKGFNQAVAAKKAGADVVMVTKLGKDDFANVALNTMKELNMDTSHLIFTDKTSTGIALICVDENTGQNQIMVVPASCDTITESEVENLSPLMDACDILLLQLEVNLSAIEKVIAMAKQKNMTIVLNTAPVQKISDALLSQIDIITPNEVEAGILTDTIIKDEKDAKRAADIFKQKGVKNVIITMGSQGAFMSTETTEKMIASIKVNAIDTTGAGDAFNGGFVTALAEGKSIEEAVKFANCVGALSVQKLGTTPSMPTRSEIDAMYNEHYK